MSDSELTAEETDETEALADDIATDDTTDPEEPTDGEPEPQFNIGDVVVVRSDFHSNYYRNVTGTIEREAEKGGSPQMLYTVKIDKPPYKLYIAGKYLQLKSEADEAASRSEEAATDREKNGAKPSFFTRFIPWRK